MRFAPALRSIVLVGAFFSVLVSTTAPAQRHQNGLFFVTSQDPAIAIGFISPLGSIATIATPAQVGSQIVPSRGISDFGNQGSIFCATGAHNGLVRLDRQGLLTTIVLDTQSVFGMRPADIAVNQDGDYDLVTTSPILNRTGPSLVRVDRGTMRVTTLLSGMFWLSPTAMSEDVETGEYVVADSQNILMPDRVFRLAPDGSNVTTLAQLSGSIPLSLPEPDLVVDSVSGDVYMTVGDGVYRIDALGRVLPFLVGGLFKEARSISLDRASGQTPRMLVALGSSNTTQAEAIISIDVTTGAVMQTVVQSPRLAQIRSIHLNQTRNITRSKQGAGDWTLLYDFPTQPGRAWVTGLGISGTRPGFTINGRRVMLNVDALTAASASGALWPVVRGATGVLDANGRGASRIDVRGIAGISGVRVWIQTFVLDPGAPGGIAIIADPTTIQF